jgi:hypothetical protein
MHLSAAGTGGSALVPLWRSSKFGRLPDDYEDYVECDNLFGPELTL